MNASDYLENLIISQLFRSGSWSKPTALYIALFTSAPSDAGGGTEVAGGGYARVARNPADANWAAPANGNGTTSNVASIDFGTASAAWGTVTHFGLFDAATGGNLLVWGQFTSSFTVASGNGFSIPAGSLSVAMG